VNFDALVKAIAEAHRLTQASAARVVNASLTIRNWLIGAYIAEFELRGEDRAEYGAELFDRLAVRLGLVGVSNCNGSRLYRYRNFYRLYPQIPATLSPELRKLLPSSDLREETQNSATVSPLSAGLSPSAPQPVPGAILLERLSYSHIELLLDIEDPLKRCFYEVESIKGNWSVRELKRQIGSLYFERSGLSRDKTKLAELANAAAVQAEPRHVFRDPYVFEFLGLRPQEVLPESDLEAALIVKLQAFLLELGHGFCFEASQKRIVVGGEHLFIDLVFYHRVIKCHVLVELKVDNFRHEHLGQLNTYVTYYRTHEMSPGDQPPVGILLCTGKNQALVEYALAGMDNRLFVSKYQLELPRAEELQRYLDEQRRLLSGGSSAKVERP
jgi:predicted nuclease of restriction endonuclease-like (RecB) superfamily